MNYDPKIDLEPYKVVGAVVRRSGFVVEKADATTFRPLNADWGIDARHVFSGTRILRGADPTQFRVLNELYARDAKLIYYTCGSLKTADYPSFEVLDPGYYFSDYGTIFEGYARDKNGIWFYAHTIGKPRVLKKADPATFRVMGYGFARDSRSVFARGLCISKADAGTFELITQRYGRDNKHVFYGNTVLEEADRDSFEIVDPPKNQAKDKNHLFECHRLVDAFSAA